MLREKDQLTALLSPHILPQLEGMNMPYVGYHLLRETLTTRLLGDSEAPILYWLGRDIGKDIEIATSAGLIMPFIRLGLGKLEVHDETDKEIAYTLTHSLFALIPQERLERTLSFEAGLIAGALSRLRQSTVHARLEVCPANPGKPPTAKIVVTL